MKVGILGRGMVGQTLASGFRSRGHEVMIGSREPSHADLQAWLGGEGAGIAAGTMPETAEFGELLVLALLGVAAGDAIAQAGPERFRGKVVIDATNPLDFSRQGQPPRLAISGDDSLGERIQRAIPDANVVKAFNTIGSPLMIDPHLGEGTPRMFIAGDDDRAKATVGEILHSFGWPEPIDIGGIEGSRELESLCILWVKVGFRRGAWDHAISLMTG
jgi:8-hydroxy-5-deazaflavin:NADPH oxidoreductase